LIGNLILVPGNAILSSVYFILYVFINTTHSLVWFCNQSLVGGASFVYC